MVKYRAGVKLFIGSGSKVQGLFYFEICTTEGRGGEKGGDANFKTKHTEPLTQEITLPLYVCCANGANHKLSAPPAKTDFRTRVRT